VADMKKIVKSVIAATEPSLIKEAVFEDCVDVLRFISTFGSRQQN
jgi:hypothetical protein